MKLEDYINKEDLTKLLDDFSKSMGIYIDAFDINGMTLLENRKYPKCEFCKYIQSNAEGVERCRKSYENVTKECYRWKNTYFSTCHAGIMLWSFPIVIENKQIGAIVCGQVLLWKPDRYFYKQLEKFNADILDMKILKGKVDQLNIISADRCESISRMLYIFVGYLTKYNTSFYNKQIEIKKWQNYMTKQINDRKKKYKNTKFDNSVYIKREKTLLQYVRTGMKGKVESLLPKICTDIEILFDFNLEGVKKACTELVVLVSRAAIDGGVECNISLDISREFLININNYKRSEELFNEMYKIIDKLIDTVYLLTDNNQYSILKIAKEYINNNYKNNITINKISNYLYISDYYLCHLFKENLNYTVNEYITRVRIEKSIEFMQNRELNIRDIMYEVGFSSQSHFTKIFKKIIGVTPGVYRNKYL